MSRRVNAAVAKTYGEVPSYELIDLPPATTNEIEIQVICVGIHRVVRSIVSGRHYIKPKTMPFIPGIDGVGKLPNGQKVYFVRMGSSSGSLSEYINIDPEFTLILPDAADPIVFSSMMNTGLGSWFALHKRAKIQSGESVLILGVTGNAGQLAATSARLLGAKHIVGVGRNTSILNQLLTDKIIDDGIILDNDEDKFQKEIATKAADVDIVIDYLWGRPTEMTMTTIHSARKDPSQRLRWIQIGQMAGPTIQCSAVILRSQNIEIIGSGIGSISPKEFLQSLEQMIPMIIQQQSNISVKTIPLKDIENKWKEIEQSKERVVVIV